MKYQGLCSSSNMPCVDIYHSNNERWLVNKWSNGHLKWNIKFIEFFSPLHLCAMTDDGKPIGSELTPRHPQNGRIQSDCPTSPRSKIRDITAPELCCSNKQGSVGGGGGCNYIIQKSFYISSKLTSVFLKMSPNFYPGIHKDPWRSDLGLPTILQWLPW